MLLLLNIAYKNSKSQWVTSRFRIFKNMDWILVPLSGNASHHGHGGEVAGHNCIGDNLRARPLLVWHGCEVTLELRRGWSESDSPLVTMQFATFTIWNWMLIGVFFLLAGVLSLLRLCGKEVTE